jgi:hypothetical protein
MRTKREQKGVQVNDNFSVVKTVQNYRDRRSNENHAPTWRRSCSKISNGPRRDQEEGQLVGYVDAPIPKRRPRLQSKQFEITENKTSLATSESVIFVRSELKNLTMAPDMAMKWQPATVVVAVPLP